MSESIEHSLIIPIYGNENNIKPLINAINNIVEDVSSKFEVVFVIDGSPDKSYDNLLKEIEFFLFSYQIISLSRNFGSFTAIRVGMEHARGKKIAVMAADLQEPIDLIVTFFKLLDEDVCDLVLGERLSRDDPKVSSTFSTLYWKFYKKFVQPEIPTGGGGYIRL